MENLHGEILHASSMYEKLVDVAIDFVDEMSEAGFTLSSHAMQSLLETCSKTDQHFRVLYIFLLKAASLLR
ncbi:hypothetical protein MtrunA17_Chr4g0075901 [Medicago truncatula]|uniref:Uncharacterized protein n=1 Tax=Medicago truncatula TaxID=3880 RepID=A0A396IHF1_MEDTR|nr:hypothetical protein MtrunA17_Chr4g0075901 [Medicago truncatula]